MKITRISIYQKDLPLEHPYWLSAGRLKFEVLDASFVKIETDDGLIGWGRRHPMGAYLCASPWTGHPGRYRNNGAVYSWA